MQAKIADVTIFEADPRSVPARITLTHQDALIYLNWDDAALLAHALEIASEKAKRIEKAYEERLQKAVIVPPGTTSQLSPAEKIVKRLANAGDGKENIYEVLELAKTYENERQKRASSFPTGSS